MGCGASTAPKYEERQEPEDNLEWAEWRKTHQAAVATPRAVDGTKMQPPPDWPEGYPWDEATAKRVDEKRVAKKRCKIKSTREFMSKHAAASYIQGCARGKQTRRQMQVLRGQGFGLILSCLRHLY
jgi:hypothetical protein